GPRPAREHAGGGGQGGARPEGTVRSGGRPWAGVGRQSQLHAWSLGRHVPIAHASFIEPGQRSGLSDDHWHDSSPLSFGTLSTYWQSECIVVKYRQRNVGSLVVGRWSLVVGRWSLVDD